MIGKMKDETRGRGGSRLQIRLRLSSVIKISTNWCP